MPRRGIAFVYIQSTPPTYDNFSPFVIKRTNSEARSRGSVEGVDGTSGATAGPPVGSPKTCKLANCTRSPACTLETSNRKAVNSFSESI